METACQLHEAADAGVPIATEKKQRSSVRAALANDRSRESSNLRERPRDFAALGFSITVLECEFSNQTLGDGFREGKTRWDWGVGPSSLFFSPLLSEPRRHRHGGGDRGSMAHFVANRCHTRRRGPKRFPRHILMRYIERANSRGQRFRPDSGSAIEATTPSPATSQIWSRRRCKGHVLPDLAAGRYPRAEPITRDIP